MTRAPRLALPGWAVLAFTMVGSPAPSQTASQTTDDALIGLWGSETVFPALQGELTVVAKGSNWRAALMGAETTFSVTGDAVRFAFPGNRGEFRGSLTDRGRRLRGFWLRPSGEAEDQRDPGGAGQPFASPLLLVRAFPSVWRGTVRPLHESFTLYVKVYRNAEGTLVGAIRNPEMNSNGGASLFRVTREGDSVRFGARSGDTSPEIVVKATLAHSPERLQMPWRDLGRTLELTRRSPTQAIEFLPRPPGELAYTYRQPPVTGDGWETARPRDVGIDEVALTRLIQRLIDADPAASRPSLIHSILVARHGKLVLEEYFFGYGRDQPHDTRSAAKTFASVILGAVMRNGTALGPETPVYKVLAGLGPFAHPDPRKAQITLANLMTHTSGLDCDDNDDRSLGNESTMQSQRTQPNWWKYTLDLPMAHAPGSRYAYCSANMNLVGGVLTTATRTWLPELFDRSVARPLQFGSYHWNLMPTGEGYLGGGAFLRPRDFLKLGQVYLAGGVWRGRRVVDAAWVIRSTAPHVEVSEATTGLAAEQFPQFYNKGNDGYAWHLNNVRSGETTHRAYEANGNGGQLVIVVPDLDLTVVFTGGNYTQGGIWGRWRDQIVGGEIIPAIRR